MRNHPLLLIYLFISICGCSESPHWETISEHEDDESCAPVCVNRILTTCDEHGREVHTPCEGETPYCGYDNGRPVCVPPGCKYYAEMLKPGETTCDDTVKVTCMEGNWSLHENCADIGQVCRQGECADCEDGSKPFCFEDQNVRHLIQCTCEPPRG